MLTTCNACFKMHVRLPPYTVPLVLGPELAKPHRQAMMFS